MHGQQNIIGLGRVVIGVLSFEKLKKCPGNIEPKKNL